MFRHCQLFSKRRLIWQNMDYFLVKNFMLQKGLLNNCKDLCMFSRNKNQSIHVCDQKQQTQEIFTNSCRNFIWNILAEGFCSTFVGVTKLNYHSRPFHIDLHCAAYLKRPRGVVAASHFSKMVTW